MSLITYDVCEAILKRYERSMHPSFICTDGFGNVGACFGDSGGPLVQYKEDGKPDLIGVASSIVVILCGALHAPTIYTKVSYFNDWINDNMEGLGSDSDNSLYYSSK